jgi:hypothetical protein
MRLAFLRAVPAVDALAVVRYCPRPTRLSQMNWDILR